MPSSTTRQYPSAVPLGSCISGIPITLHFSFFLLLLLEFANAILRNNGYPLFILFVVVLYGPVLLITILVHEFGHALYTKRLGGEVGGIVLWPLGGFALCGPTEGGCKGDLKVALAGPLTHVPMGFVWWIIYAAIGGGQYGLWPSWTIYVDVLSSSAAGFFQVLAAQAFYLNILLLCFNLFIPAYPLDGGRIYASSLILVLKMEPLKAAKITAITAMLISSGIVIYGILGLLAITGGTFLLLLVGIYVGYQSYELWIAAKRKELGNHPIFGRGCYQSSDLASSSGGGQVPAQADEAVMT